MENLDLPILQICNSGTLFPLQTAHASRVVLRVVVAAKLVTRESDQKIYVAMYSSQAVHGTMGILHNHPKAYICLYICIPKFMCFIFVRTYIRTYIIPKIFCFSLHIIAKSPKFVLGHSLLFRSSFTPPVSWPYAGP